MSNIINYHHYLGLEDDPLTPGGTGRLSTVKGGSAIQMLGNRKGKVRWGLAGKLNRMDEPEPLNLGVRQGRWSRPASLTHAQVEWLRLVHPVQLPSQPPTNLTLSVSQHLDR